MLDVTVPKIRTKQLIINYVKWYLVINYELCILKLSN